MENSDFYKSSENEEEEIKVEITKVPSSFTSQNRLQFASLDKGIGDSFVLN